MGPEPRRALIPEIKGFEDDEMQARHQAAKPWISAVKNWGKLGQWEFAVCRKPHELPRVLKYVARLSTSG
jgi:type III restriction enzyme